MESLEKLESEDFIGRDLGSVAPRIECGVKRSLSPEFRVYRLLSARRSFPMEFLSDESKSTVFSAVHLSFKIRKTTTDQQRFIEKQIISGGK
jgi:hypothetical protein